MNTYGQSASLFLSLRLSRTLTLCHLSRCLRPSFDFTYPLVLCSVRYIAVHIPAPSHGHPVAPTRTLCEAPPRFPTPCDEQASLQRQQERPSRNGAALCPEFVPRRSPCSFTRGDKSGASLSHTPTHAMSLSLFLYRLVLFGTLTLPLRLCPPFFLYPRVYLVPWESCVSGISRRIAIAIISLMSIPGSLTCTEYHQ